MASEVPPRRGTVRWPALAGAVAFMVAAVAVCGALGWWQWQRAQDQATTVTPEPAVPLSEVLTPGASPGAAVGRQVTVTGRWAEADAALVYGREVDGTPAAFLVRPLTVDADQTGTGQPATLAVLVGWRPDDAVVAPDADGGHVTVSGYLRAGEASRAGADVPATTPAGTFATSTMALSAFAQVWDPPLYSALVASYDGSDSWQVLPPREAERELDFRSVAYAIEWWIFGAFFVFIAARWIRDNGRNPAPTPRDEETTAHE